MKKCRILLSSVNTVKEFVEIVTHCDFEVDLSSGRHLVDAKSILGIFSLDLSKPIELIAHTDNADALFERLKKFSA